MAQRDEPIPAVQCGAYGGSARGCVPRAREGVSTRGPHRRQSVLSRAHDPCQNDQTLPDEHTDGRSSKERAPQPHTHGTPYTWVGAVRRHRTAASELNGSRPVAGPRSADENEHTGASWTGGTRDRRALVKARELSPTQAGEAAEQ